MKIMGVRDSDSEKLAQVCEPVPKTRRWLTDPSGFGVRDLADRPDAIGRSASF
jgi:hypothetical protein